MLRLSAGSGRIRPGSDGRPEGRSSGAMTPPSFARDDTILALLWAGGPAGTVQLAVQLGFHERRVRRGLRKLIDGGYVFASEHGLYRITAAGAAALAPVAERVELQDPGADRASNQPPPRIYARLRSRR